MKTLYFLAMALAFIAFLLNKKRLDKRVHIAGHLMAVRLLWELTNDVLRHYRQPTAFLWNLGFPCCFFLTALLFHRHLTGRRCRRVVLLFCGPFIVYWLALVLLRDENLYENLFSPYLMADALLCILSIMYCLQLSQDIRETSLLRQPMFWISAGTLLCNAIYAGYDLFSQSFNGYRYTSYRIDSQILWLFGITEIFFYLIAFVCTVNFRKKLSSPSPLLPE